MTITHPINTIVNRLRDAGCIYTGYHFVLKSGRHTGSYINLDPAFGNSHLMETFGHRLAAPFYHDVPDIVLGPAIGGISLAIYTGFGFGTQTRPLALWAEKSDTDGGFKLTRGFDRLVTGKRVLVIEDMLTTGGSLKAVIDAARSAGATVIGGSVIFNRGNIHASQLELPKLHALCYSSELHADLDTFAAHNCPLCQEERPIVTNVGYGAEFAHDNPRYTGGYETVTV